MKRLVLILLGAMSAFAQAPSAAQRVADDAVVIDRVAEASKRDLPTDLLKRIVTEDIDLLRGKRSDGTYQFATYERLEAGRTNSSFSIQPRGEKMQTIELKGAFVYRVLLDAPSRRLLVRKNRPLWVERVDVEYVAQNSNQPARQSFDVKAVIQPGQMKPIDLPAVARQATIRVVANVEEGGYGNLDVALVHARVVDNADSPYIDAVTAAKAIARALENGDIASMRAMARRMGSALGTPKRVVTTPVPAASTMNVTAPPDTAAQLELQTELQLIEDLLTGTESERREGLDRLHQLVRRVRH